MQEKNLPKRNGASLPKPNLNGKKDFVEAEESHKPLSLKGAEFLFAIRSGWTEDAEEYIKKGANLEERDNLGTTPLMVAASENQSHICTVLIEKGAKLEAKDISGFTPLMHAAKAGHIHICKLLLDKGADANARNKKDWTALMMAAMRGHIGLCSLLLDRGADVDAKNDCGMAAAVHAEKSGHVGLASFLRVASLVGADKTVAFFQDFKDCLNR